MDGAAGPRFTMVPIPRRHKQNISRLQNLIEKGRAVRQGRLAVPPDWVGNGRPVNLPALASFRLDDDEILEIIVQPEGAILAAGDDQADIDVFPKPCLDLGTDSGQRRHERLYVGNNHAIAVRQTLFELVGVRLAAGCPARRGSLYRFFCDAKM